MVFDSKKVQTWAIIIMSKVLFMIGLWYLSSISSALEKLNTNVTDLKSTVQHVNDKMIFMEDKLNFHDRQIEKILNEKNNTK